MEECCDPRNRGRNARVFLCISWIVELVTRIGERLRLRAEVSMELLGC